MAVVIYGLTDPRSGEVRYIGKANDAARLNSHKRDARRRKSPLYSWMSKLAAEGLEPGLVELELADDWREAERRLIAEARARGDRLLNLAEGGDEPFCSPEVRAENGRKVAAAIHSDPLRRRAWELNRGIGSAIRDGYGSNAARAKLREAARLRPDLFGRWLNVPDRTESPGGAPL